METPKVNKWKNIYIELSQDLPEESIERSKGSETRKGYDTAGYGYQYIVNRFNEVLGIDGWGFTYTEIERKDGSDRNGNPRISVTMDCTITIGGQIEGALNIQRTCTGGHISNNYSDARKGAITNAFKKTAALFGVGRKAYEGSIDDDNKPMSDGGEYEVRNPLFDGVAEPEKQEKVDYVEKMKQRNEKVAGQICKECGNGKYVISAKGKIYCSNKCWLNLRQSVPLPQDENDMYKQYQEYTEDKPF